MTDLINKSTRTWTPARTPAARASGGGDSLPASVASSKSQTGATASMNVIEEVYGMDEPDVGWEPPNGWAGFVMMMIAASLAGIGVGIGIASLIIRWLI